MRISRIETFTVGAGWKNWLFVRVDTDEGLSGIGEGTLNGFVRTIEAAVHELEHLALGEDPRRVTALARRLYESVSNEGGHVHRHAIAAIEIACWDILGKSLGVPVHELLGGRVRDACPRTRTAGTATSARRRRSRPRPSRRREGLPALKLDPFGTAQGFSRGGRARDGARDRRSAPLAPSISPDPDRRPCALRRGRGDSRRPRVRAARRLLVGGADDPRSGAVAGGRPRHAAAGRHRRDVPHARTVLRAGEGRRRLDLAARADVARRDPADPRRRRPRRRRRARGSRRTSRADRWRRPSASSSRPACPTSSIQEHFDPFNEPWTARPRHLDADAGRRVR